MQENGKSVSMLTFWLSFHRDGLKLSATPTASGSLTVVAYSSAGTKSERYVVDLEYAVHPSPAASQS